MTRSIAIFAFCIVLIILPRSTLGTSLTFEEGTSVKVPDASVLDLMGPFTIEAWVRPQASIVVDFCSFVVSKNINGTGYALLARGDGYRFESNNVGTDHSAQAPGPLLVGEWVHVVGVWDGSLNRILVDGVLVATTPVSAAPVGNDQDLWIGGSVFGSDTSWRGEIDEVRIWDSARSDDLIAANRFLSFLNPVPDLVGYWKFDEGQGLMANDSSGFGNHGVLDPPVWSLDNAPVTSSSGQVPEPTTLSMIVLGLGLVVLGRRRLSPKPR